jgi:HD-GYP domain-containing protein (c-di-GMP phosphodiesterase class II)
VADYSTVIATERGLPTADVERVRNAAVLHDIGKIAVAEQVLSKKGPLDDAELDAVRAHPAAGHSIVESISSLHRFIPGIRHHHEWMNGSGYPDGIRGNSIHMDARIIAVADVFDVLTTDRSYLDAWPAERAREILIAESGDHFDPMVVDAFMQADVGVRVGTPDVGISPVGDGA